MRGFFQTWLSIRLDSVRRALGLAHAAVNAFIRMDDEHIFAFVETIHRAHFDAIHKFALDAVVGNDVGHEKISSGGIKSDLG